MTTALGDNLLSLFKQRLELLTEVHELTGRLCRCVEQGKTQRVDRLIGRREDALRRWRDVENGISAGVASAGEGVLSGPQKARLHELVTGAEELIEAIRQGNERIEQELNARRTAIANEISAVRKGRKTLQAYARDASSSTEGGLDRNV
jgi:hypothetical protein